MKSTNKGIKRILKAFTYSYDGFRAAFKTEEAFRQDLLVFVIGTIVSIFLPITLFLLDILKNSGYNVIWLKNDDGCKE